jgi:hypothetical protein
MASKSATPLAGVAEACHEPSMRIPATAIPAPTATESLSVIGFSLGFLIALHRRFSIRLMDEKACTLRAVNKVFHPMLNTWGLDTEAMKMSGGNECWCARNAPPL